MDSQMMPAQRSLRSTFQVQPIVFLNPPVCIFLTLPCPMMMMHRCPKGQGSPVMANQQPSLTGATNQNTGSLTTSTASLQCDQEADPCAQLRYQTATYNPFVVIEDIEYVGCELDPDEDCRPGRRWSHRVATGGERDTGGSVQGRGRVQQGAKPSATQQEQTQSRAQKGRPPTPLGKQAQTCDSCVTSVDVNHLGVSGTQSESAINGEEIAGGQRLFYGAHVGSETRNVEFKRGGGEYLRSLFRAHLRRYACAFLNSGGGSLLVGVDDGGVVRGIRCNHKQEDRARLLVDSILKGFHPALLPHSYTLAFIPVVRLGPEGHNLKVLRLTLSPPPALTWRGLYQTDNGDVFLRRDGSVEGPLSAGAVQEWARQRWCAEVIRLQHCVESLLSEQRLLLREIRQQSQAIVALQSGQTRSHVRLHTDTEPRPHVNTPATGSLMQRLRKARKVTPADPENQSLITPQNTALAQVPFTHPEPPGGTHHGPLLSTGPSQCPGLPQCPRCQFTERREKKTQSPISNICRLM